MRVAFCTIFKQRDTMMNKDNYKRLGHYIQLIDVRNKALEVNNLLGLSIEKKFISFTANTIDTNLSLCKIVQSQQYGYGSVTCRNSNKITIVQYDGEILAIENTTNLIMKFYLLTKLALGQVLGW